MVEVPGLVDRRRIQEDWLGSGLATSKWYQASGVLARQSPSFRDKPLAEMENTEEEWIGD